VKILYICPDTGIDVLGSKGSSIHVREMIAAFARAGHEVDLVAPRLTKVGVAPAHVHAAVHRIRVPDDVQETKDSLENWVDNRDCVTSLPKDIRRILFDQHLVTQLDQMYADDPPDLIYVRASILSTAGIELAAQTVRPLVVELNTPLADEQENYRSGALGSLYRAAEQELLRAATAVVVVSHTLAMHAQRLGVDPARILTLPNAIDPTRFTPRSAEPRTPVLGFVGGLRAWHGVNLLPEVLALVRKRVQHARLVIAGDGPLRSELERQSQALGLADSVTFLGAVDHDQMPNVIRSFSVALAPYPPLDHDFYFSPMKVFEYMGCGVPVVASNVGQIGQLVSHQRNAILVEPGDVAGLADACCELLLDPRTASRIGQSGAELVHHRYTWDHNAETLLSALVARC
jgi:glycosyltransferase involved in cell wall biosynthesis